MNKKIAVRKSKGFTFVESLVALLMVTLITALVLIVVNLANKTYSDFEMNAEGQILTSTLMANIQDELAYATEVEKYGSKQNIEFTDSAGNKVSTDGYSFTYRSDVLGFKNCCLTASNEVIYIKCNDNGNMKSLTGNSAYVMDLGAGIDTYYLPSLKQFYVSISVFDSGTDKASDVDNREVITTSFVVDPLNSNLLP